MREPRVVLFDAYPHALGGAQQTTLAVAAELAGRGADPVLMTTGEGPLADSARATGVAVAVVELPRSLQRFGATTTGRHRIAATASLPVAWARLRREIVGSGADVVHANDHRGVLLAGPAARAGGVPYTWHVHSVDVGGAWIERALGRWAAGVVVPSRAARTALRLAGATPTAVVPAPVADAVAALGPAPAPRAARLVTAGRLHPVKGIADAVAAVAALRRSGHAVCLDVYGAPQPGIEDHERDLRELVAALELGDAVRFHGHVTEPHAHWLGAAAYLQPSRAETFGMAAAEAMALGLPVVATGVGGLTELIEDGRTGLLVPPGDPAAIAGAVAALLEDPARAQAIGAAARAASSVLTAAATTDALLDLWRQVAR